MIRIVNFLLHADMIIVHCSTRLYEHVWVPLCVHPAALFFHPPSLPALRKKKNGSLSVMKAFGPLISGHRHFADSYWKQKKSIRKAERAQSSEKPGFVVVMANAFREKMKPGRKCVL